MNLPNIVIPPWVKYAVAAVAVGLAVWYYSQWLIGIGENKEKTKWLGRENKELATANATILDLQAKNRAFEKSSEQRIAEIATKYEKENQIEKVKSDRAITDLRAGNSGLFYALTSAQGAVADGVSRTVARPGGRDGGAEARLPGEVAGDLHAQADRANAIVRQLTACQQIIIEDRKLCHK